MKKKNSRISDEQKEDLRYILDGYDPKKIESFICAVEYNFAFIDSLKNNPRRKEHVQDLRRMQQRLKKTLDDLRSLATTGLIPQQGLKDTWGQQIGVILSSWSPAWNCMKKSYPPLKELIRLIEEALNQQRSRAGQPKADNSGLITMIAESYERYIDVPSPYPGSRKNFTTFTQVIEAILGEDRDHSRGIRQALKERRRKKMTVLK